MSNYRRLYIPGGTYSFTLVTYQRQPIFTDPQHIDLLRQAFREVKSKRPFDLLAIVILPDHLHCIWRLPEGDADFSTRWQMVKTAFSRRVPAITNKDGAKLIWQPRFYEHCIRDEADFNKHLDYIHYNPVKHGIALNPVDWPYSSFHRFETIGWYTNTWGNTVPDDVEDFDHE